MNAWEISTINHDGEEKLVHVVAPDEGHAVIEFRDSYSLDEWRIGTMRRIIQPAVIELP